MSGIWYYVRRKLIERGLDPDVLMSPCPMSFEELHKEKQMNKPHKHAELIHAWAEGAVIQVKGFADWYDDSMPSWTLSYEYRIKPKEHTEQLHVSYRGGLVLSAGPYCSANLRCTFDPDTGALKTAEVLK